MWWVGGPSRVCGDPGCNSNPGPGDVTGVPAVPGDLNVCVSYPTHTSGTMRPKCSGLVAWLG